ncbi:hypothetical protein ACIA5G_08870 [Amycolatopsis sp. NPDC051758]|jgi:hypothetical protein|uniref:hypothetical protein n=1 Tax=Amycolatopsis sp. NPDC051758 TaxID=3363935 RepID=UPI0037A00FAC
MGNEVNMSAPSGGGGFTFDADKIDGVIKQWQDLQTDLQNDAADANLMADVKAPGKEFASGDWEKLANPSGKAFLEQNQKMQEYVKNYIQALLDAKKKITAADADHTGDISKAGTQA